jgi:hypothetical protein
MLKIVVERRSNWYRNLVEDTVLESNWLLYNHCHPTYNDAMASLTMASLADGGSNGGGHRQLCSSGWRWRHHPFIGVDGGGKVAIAAATSNHHFHQEQLLSLPLTLAIAAATQSMVNGGGGLSR